MIGEKEATERAKEIVRVLQTIYDPEIPISIYELGLIYEINLQDNKIVEIVMTLTSPNCPVAESLPVEVKTKVEELVSIEKAIINVVFEPKWGMHLLSEAAMLELNL
jgi:FeS assembly SUF system protein